MTDYEPTVEESTDLDERDVRALTQYLTVLEDQGRVRGCEDLYLVVSQSGREYLVDARQGTCECPDHEYRGVHCKHLRRVAFATGERPIPDDVEGVDPQLGEHVSTGPRAVATDGGVLETRLPFEICVELPESTVNSIDVLLAGSRADTVEEWITAQVQEATARDVVNAADVAGDSAYTVHVEPEEQGGEMYLRCCECNREILVDIGVDRLTHADSCPNAETC